MSVVELVPDQPSDEIRVLFTRFLKDLTTCKTMVEVNIAAGIALQTLLALST